MGQAVLAAEQTVRRVAHAVTRGVGDRRFLDIHPQAELGADTTAMHSVAGRIGPELVALERQREPRLGHLDAAELDAAGRLPLAGCLPAVADGRRAAAGARVEHVPDERLSRPGIHALDRDPKATAPARHDALRTGRRP